MKIFIIINLLIIIMIIYTEGNAQLPTGLNVFYRFWKSEKNENVILGIHGFAEHSGRYDELARYLANNGYSFLMYDLRGHGKTANGQNIGYVKNFNDFLNDTEEFIKIIKEKIDLKNIMIYGHSMGGLIVLHYISTKNNSFKGAITSGPATIMNMSLGNKISLNIFGRISPKSRVKLPIKPEYLTHEKEIWEAYERDPLVFKNPTVSIIFQMYKASKSIWNNLNKIELPILMLHGGSDMIVPKLATEKSFELIASKDKTKKIYDGMYHEIHNEIDRKLVYEDIINWISKHS